MNLETVCRTCRQKATAHVFLSGVGAWIHDGEQGHAVVPKPGDEKSRKRLNAKLGRRPRAPRPLPAPVPRSEPTLRPQCGTDAGYSQHRYHWERACEPCREAHRETMRLYPKEAV